MENKFEVFYNMEVSFCIYKNIFKKIALMKLFLENDWV